MDAGWNVKFIYFKLLINSEIILARFTEIRRKWISINKINGGNRSGEQHPRT